MPRSERSPLLPAGPPAASGAAPFASPRPFAAIVPRALPGSPMTWTLVSGAAEPALAACAALPRARRRAAQAEAVGRLPIQPPLVLWARAVARNTEAAR